MDFSVQSNLKIIMHKCLYALLNMQFNVDFEGIHIGKLRKSKLWVILPLSIFLGLWCSLFLEPAAASRSCHKTAQRAEWSTLNGKVSPYLHDIKVFVSNTFFCRVLPCQWAKAMAHTQEDFENFVCLFQALLLVVLSRQIHARLRDDNKLNRDKKVLVYIHFAQESNYDWNKVALSALKLTKVAGNTTLWLRCWGILRVYGGSLLLIFVRAFLPPASIAWFDRHERNSLSWIKLLLQFSTFYDSTYSKLKYRYYKQICD